MGSLTCVMYHYIQNSKDSFYKNFNYLPISKFRKQISYFQKDYTIISPDEAKNLITLKKFNKNYIWLTFDDGYKSHFDVVLPELRKRNIKASFFPITNSMLGLEVNQANKLHFLLSKFSKKKNLLILIKKLIVKFTHNNNFYENILKKINLSSRYDDRETLIIKRLLQRDLDFKLREKVLNKLLKLVDFEKKYILKKLYFDLDNAKEMIKEGHEIGMHTNYHPWLNYLAFNKQKGEIEKNIKIYKKKKLFFENISFCYPYGSFNKNTVNILKKNKINFGLTTNPKKLKENFNPRLIPRFDTNDFNL